MHLNLPIDINKVKGFLDPKEGEALYNFAKQYALNGSCLEIGSYCGKSAVYLGKAVKENDQKLYSIDHHKGSEEQQPGEEYFDPDLRNKNGDGIDTLPFFLDTIEKSDLEGFVIPIVSTSEEAYEDLNINFDMVFIDGGHSEEAAQKDYDLWTQRINIGGLLAIHDVFPNPEDGGRPPYNIYIRALESGEFEELEIVQSLRLLKKIK
ncbi:class I SAM-dependent methyltransferase [Gammaproteobacteria bacterium]|nr:class I SAM-dependent methyltransferase [Gammaproteobacteria bacterium]